MAETFVRVLICVSRQTSKLSSQKGEILFKCSLNFAFPKIHFMCCPRLDLIVRVFTGRKESIASKSICNVATSSAVLSNGKIRKGSWGLGLVELEGSLAETSKSRRLGQRLKATTGKCLKAFLQRSEKFSK